MQPQEDEAATGQPQASDATPEGASTARRDGGHDSAEPRGTATGDDSAGSRRASDDARAVEGLRAAVMAFARARLAPLSAEDAAVIAALRDERALNELVDTLAQATSLDEARAVFAAAIAGTRT